MTNGNTNNNKNFLACFDPAAKGLRHCKEQRIYFYDNIF